jgi:hypothetical protein
LAVSAIRKRGEVEFLTLIAVVNAILTAGKTVAAAVTGNESPGTETLNKSIAAVKTLLLPHWAEDTERKAQSAKELLMREVAKGPFQIKVVGGDISKKRRNRR